MVSREWRTADVNGSGTEPRLMGRTCFGLVFALLLLLSGCAVHRGTLHEIEKGQTLWRISQVYDVELDTLLKVNDIDNPSTVRAGTNIVIPGAERVRDVPATPQRTVQRSTSSTSSSAASTDNPAPETNSNSSSDRTTGNNSSPSSSSAPSDPGGSTDPEPEPGDAESNAEAPTQYFDPVWPCEGRLASRFKKSKGPTERGIRIHTSEGSLVKAAEEGNIKLAGSWDKMPELGKIVIIFHSHDFTTVYAHLKSLNVSEGETVNRGQPIGAVGQTGAVDRAMCYFEVRYELEPRDPLIFLGEST
jgi:lipoprotein NlpD